MGFHMYKGFELAISTHILSFTCRKAIKISRWMCYDPNYLQHIIDKEYYYFLAWDIRVSRETDHFTFNPQAHQKRLLDKFFRILPNIFYVVM